MGPDADGREHPGGGGKIVESTEEGCIAEVEIELLQGFPDGRGLEVGIAGGPAAPRERHLTGPGVARVLGAPHEEHRIGVFGCHDERHRRPGPVRVVDLARDMSLELSGEAIHPGQLSPQPPPQHPPAGGPGAAQKEGTGVPERCGAGTDRSFSGRGAPQAGQVTASRPRTRVSN